MKIGTQETKPRKRHNAAQMHRLESSRNDGVGFDESESRVGWEGEVEEEEGVWVVGS